MTSRSVTVACWFPSISTTRSGTSITRAWAKENLALGFPWRLGLWVSRRFLAKPNWHIIGLSPLAAEILADPRGTFVGVNLIEPLQGYRIEPDFSDSAIASTGASFLLRSVASPLVRSGWYTPVADADRKLMFRVLDFDAPS